MATATALGGLLPGLPLATGIDMSAISDNAPALAAYLDDPLFQTTTRLGLAADLLAAAASLPDVARTLPVPALFLHGALDRLAPWDAALPAEIGGPTRTVIVFPRGYHNLFLDLARADVVAAIVAWLTEQGALRRVAGEDRRRRGHVHEGQRRAGPVPAIFRRARPASIGDNSDRVRTTNRANLLPARIGGRRQRAR